ncbi:OpgC domain-containing protein, partial [Staphylococcus aureus]
ALPILTPIRLLQFLALAVVFSTIFPLIYRAIPWIGDQLSLLGRNSLNVFCVASLLSLSGQIIRFVYLGSFFIDTLVFVVGVGLLWLTAWVSEWQG